MEEAELLSDKLIVLNHGQIKCTGTPLQLKNMLGKGYRVSLICDKKDVTQVRSLMQTIMPSSSFLESSGESGGMVFNLPINQVKELGAIFSILDSQEQGGKRPERLSTSGNDKRSQALQTLSSLVSDVGVSQTSLEEVFMAVTSEN